MNPSLENPFRPQAKRATKRLFGGGQVENVVPKTKIKEKLERVKFKYGPHEILKKQVSFLKEIEKLIPEEKLKDYEVESAKEILINRIEVENGEIINLGLSYLDLPELPELPASLHELQCSNNKLERLPVLPNHLLKFNCNENQLTELPSIPDSLQELSCGNNLLTAIPKLPASLDRLFCEHNQLKTLPQLPASLTYLNCSMNKLTVLPPLPNLYGLECQFNRLTTLPELPDLSYLDCGNNLFADYKAEEKKVKALKEYDGYNHFKI